MKHLYNALVSKGFVKAFLYSFGSFLAGWILVFLQDKDVALSLGQYAIIIPTINIILVAVKQTWDSYRSS